MAPKKDELLFQQYRLILQQAMGEGYRTKSIRQNQRNIRDVLDVMCEPGEVPIVVQDPNEKNRYLFRPPQDRMDTNYLFRIYSLCAVPDSRTAYAPAQIMQVLAESESRPDPFLSRNAIQTRLQYALEAGGGNVKNLKLASSLDRLRQRGLLQIRSHPRRSQTDYRLMPALSDGLLQGQNRNQLRRLCRLIPLFSDRCMPESWGYRVQHTIGMLLDEDPGQDPSLPIMKSDSRPRLMMDDGVLWDLLSARAMNRWVQVDYRFPSTGHSVRSGSIQPLFIRTNPGEGRSYLAAWSREIPGEPEARPVILPLDMIQQVYLMESQEGLRSPAECADYLHRWFAHSFSGISPAACDFRGRIQPPVPIRLHMDFRAEKNGKPRPRPRSALLGPGEESEDGSVVYSLLVTRPEDLEPTLLQYDACITHIETPGHPFAGIWRERRQLFRQVGIIDPLPPVEIILPLGRPQPDEPTIDNDSPLLHPDNNIGIQNTIKAFNHAVDSRSQFRNPEFVPYRADRPVPVRLGWAELDWLERFVQDPLVRCMLEESFTDQLQQWLNDALACACVSGYVRRLTADFLYINRPRGELSDEQILCRRIMLPILDAFENRQQVEVENKAYDGSVIRGKVLPLQLEYRQGTASVYLQMLDTERDRIIYIRCSRLQAVRPIANTPHTGKPAGRMLLDLSCQKQHSLQLIVSSDPAYRVRVIGMLQPYLTSVFEDPNGVLRIDLTYRQQDEVLLLRFLRLLLPGIIPVEGTSRKLLDEFASAAQHR